MAASKVKVTCPRLGATALSTASGTFRVGDRVSVALPRGVRVWAFGRRGGPKRQESSGPRFPRRVTGGGALGIPQSFSTNSNENCCNLSTVY